MAISIIRYLFHIWGQIFFMKKITVLLIYILLLQHFSAKAQSFAINTTGAGDAFGSGFCTGMILKNDWDFGLRLAILNSNGVIQRMGAKNGLLKHLPKQSDLNKIKIGIFN